MAITAHQRTVLNFIGEFQKKHGYSPSLADLAVAFGVKSKNSIAKVVNALVLQEENEKDPKGRIKIRHKQKDEKPSIFSAFTLPLFGPIAAGFAAPVEEQAEETVNLEQYLIKDRSSTFLLRVKGESMINAGIHEGDLVIVDRSKTPKVNDIVVGILDGEFTLKRLKKGNGKFYLQAENPDYPDLYAMDELKIGGVVVGTVRKY